LTAGAITGERERKTYEVLRTTLLSARKLVWGKLAVALSFMLLLILASLPLQSLAFILGGVTLVELLAGLTMLLAATFFFAVVGLFFSSWLRRTLVSTVLTYVVSLLIIIGVPIFMLLSTSLVGVTLDNLDRYALVIQVFIAYLINFLVGVTPLPAALFSEIMLEEYNSLFFSWETLTRMGTGQSIRIPLIAPWIIYTVASVLVGLILLRIAIRRVQRQERK
jgi:ABC-type transport system involved in multi-copper enzyme maturation permease subunit